MLCCIPVNSFKSSKPKGKSSRSGMPSTVQTDADTESGIFYLVPNKNGPGKSLVRRPRPPPTSPPLPDDFDALTQGGQSTYTRGGTGGGGGHGIRSGWEKHGHASHGRGHANGMGTLTGAPSSVSPLDDDFDATYTAGATLTRKAGSSMDHGMDGYDGVKGWLKGSESSPGRSRNHASGRGGAPSSEEYGDHMRYVDDLKRRFDSGGSPNLALTPSRNRKELPRGGSLARERDLRVDRIGPPARLGSIPKPASSNTVPTKAANEFQEVNRRIVEDGPERTVLISTWREQVADAIETDTVVDVYYLNEGDFAEGAAEENQEMKATITRRESFPPRPATSAPSIDNERSEIRSLGGGPVEPKSITESFSSERGPTLPPKSQNHSYHSEFHARNGSGSGASPRRTPPLRVMTPDTHGKHPPSSSSSHNVPASGRGGKIPLNTNLSPPRASTSSWARNSSFPAMRSSKALHQPLTPSEMYGTNPAPPSFRPTQSGSTISTIKSASASATAFEDVLASCEPSLLHISPALTSLGITNESHLKAITKMSEETRDRVVKEEALKQGITVMEWAILLDRVQYL